MEILFPNTGEEADWNDSRRLIRKHNAQRAKLIRRRLDDVVLRQTCGDALVAGPVP